MMRHDSFLLAIGFVRTFIWLVGAVYAYRFKRWMVCAGFTLTGLNSVSFAFTNAHYIVNTHLVHVSAYLSPIFVALIIGGFILGTVVYPQPPHWRP